MHWQTWVLLAWVCGWIGVVSWWMWRDLSARRKHDEQVEAEAQRRHDEWKARERAGYDYALDHWAGKAKDLLAQRDALENDVLRLTRIIIAKLWDKLPIPDCTGEEWELGCEHKGPDGQCFAEYGPCPKAEDAGESIGGEDHAD